MYKKVQILFSSATNSDEIHPYFREEAIAFSKAGFIVSTTPCEDAECIIYRGVSIITSQNTHPAERETQPIAPKRSLTSSYPISFFLR